MDWTSFLTPEILYAIGIIFVALVVFLTKGKIDQKTAMIVWNFIENLISNAKEMNEPNSSKQALVVNQVQQGMYKLPKNAQKLIKKKVVQYGGFGELVNNVYNHRKWIKLGFISIKKLFKVL